MRASYQIPLGGTNERHSVRCKIELSQESAGSNWWLKVTIEDADEMARTGWGGVIPTSQTYRAFSPRHEPVLRVDPF